MYFGNYQKKGAKKPIRSGVLLASLGLMLTLSVGTTVAYLVDETSQVENTFRPASADIQITEDFNGQVKSSIQVTNTGDINAYIRATLVMYWIDSNGVIVKPENCSYSGGQINTDWITVGDIYYYIKPVSPGTSIELLASPITAQISPENTDYRFVVEVLTEAIQAEPTDAIEDAWKDVNVQSDGSLVCSGGA